MADRGAAPVSAARAAIDSPPIDSIVALAQALVRIPSRGGDDSPGPIIEAVRSWLVAHGVEASVLRSAAGQPVAVLGEIVGVHPGPAYCLDACLDTAPFGDPATWNDDPLSGTIAAGRLHGRGAADSKIAVAIFCHLAAELARTPEQLHGRLLVLFDADEHTGRFGGARAFLAEHPEVAGAMIGYPGHDAVVVGARGFYRATARLRGVAGHSGARRRQGPNAIEKAGHLVELLRATALPDAAAPDFPLGPSLTVTGIRGGESFSIVPDLCEVMVDVRLTPDFGADDARRLLRRLIAQVDEVQPGPAASDLEELESWPAYRLPGGHPVARALLDAARRQGRPDIAARVGGPSNIGNLFAAHEVGATCGFGVGFENIHAANETAAVADVPDVFTVYRAAVGSLLGLDHGRG